MKKFSLGIFFIAILLTLRFFYMGGGDTWTGFYYPDKHDLSKYIQGPALESTEECYLWIEDQMEINNPFDKDYYSECGKNCKYSRAYNTYSCEEIIK